MILFKISRGVLVPFYFRWLKFLRQFAYCCLHFFILTKSTIFDGDIWNSFGNLYVLNEENDRYWVFNNVPCCGKGKIPKRICISTWKPSIKEVDIFFVFWRHENCDFIVAQKLINALLCIEHDLDWYFYWFFVLVDEIQQFYLRNLLLFFPDNFSKKNG